MVQLVLDPTQADIIAKAHGTVTVCDPSGKVVAYLNCNDFTEAEIAESQRRRTSQEPCLKTNEVLERLKSLESR